MTNRSMPDERGSLGGIEGLAFGVLVFAFGTLMVVNAWAVVDAKIAASDAAREAMRAYVESENASLASQSATEAARSALGDRRAPNARVSIEHQDSSEYARCTRATATVEIPVPRVSLPFIGGTGGTIAVRAGHSEVIDPYRSGLAVSQGTAAVCTAV